MSRKSTLEQIGLLARTAALGSISAAAAEIGLSSSLASRKLAALEKELGARLLQRTTRSLQVTAAGALVVRWAQSSLDGFEAMLDELHALQGRPAGLVRIACTEFATRHPEIKATVLTTDRAVQLGEGQVDVAIHVGQVPDSNLVVRRVRDVRTLLCASPAYLAALGTQHTPADLVHHRCLVHSTYEPRNWFFRKGGDLIVHPLAPHVTTSRTALLHALALEGVGIARMSSRMLRADLRSGALVSVLDDYARTLSNGELPAVWMIFPDHHLLHRTRLVVDAIVERMTLDREPRAVSRQWPDG